MPNEDRILSVQFGSGTPIPIGANVPADSLRYTAQSLTSEQQTQARTNIGAASSDALAGKQDAPLSGQAYNSNSGDYVTPSQANDALEAGRDVAITWMDGDFGALLFKVWNLALSMDYIFSNTIVFYNGYYILYELFGDVSSNIWDTNVTILATPADIPTNVSELNNDSGYLASETDPTVPAWAKAATKPAYTASEVGALPSTTLYAGSQSAAGPADKAVSIPMGQVDSTSTATAFTATIPGITELRDGVCVYLRNGVVTSAENCTLNINGLGAKPLYSSLAASSRSTTIFNVNYAMLFVYNSTRVSGGCWDVFYGYDSNTNTIGYQLRTNSLSLPMSEITYRYRLLFTSADGSKFVPANTSTSTNATASRAVNQTKINPFGKIVYYGTTTSVAAGSRPGVAYLWSQYNITLGYSFNRTGAALTLTQYAPVYIKCAPQSDGSAIIDATTPYVQELPTTADGKIYIYLGVATAATTVEIVPEHPVYCFRNGMIQQWTGLQAEIDGLASDISSFEDIAITSANADNHGGDFYYGLAGYYPDSLSLIITGGTGHDGDTVYCPSSFLTIVDINHSAAKVTAAFVIPLVQNPQSLTDFTIVAQAFWSSIDLTNQTIEFAGIANGKLYSTVLTISSGNTDEMGGTLSVIDLENSGGRAGFVWTTTEDPHTDSIGTKQYWLFDYDNFAAADYVTMPLPGDLVYSSATSCVYPVRVVNGNYVYADPDYSIRGATGPQGTAGATFTPAVSSAGVISWSNDGGKTNPQSVDLVAAVLAALPVWNGGAY